MIHSCCSSFLVGIEHQSFSLFFSSVWLWLPVTNRFPQFRSIDSSQPMTIFSFFLRQVVEGHGAAKEAPESTKRQELKRYDVRKVHYRVLPSFTEFCWVLPSFTEFYRVLLGFTEFYLVLPSFTGFYRVLLSFTGFHRVLPSFTEFYRVLPSFRPTGSSWYRT